MKTTDTHAAALATFLNISPEEVTPMKWDHYGLPQFSAEGAEYAVGTDDEANEAAMAEISQSVWAFNASFICSMCELPSEFEDGIKLMQEKCESANDPLLALVEKLCGLPLFVNHAIAADGRGHFLSGYDGEENEVEHDDGYGAQTFYVYRTN